LPRCAAELLHNFAAAKMDDMPKKRKRAKLSNKKRKQLLAAAANLY